MWKALLWLVAIVFAITLIMEYWIWFLLALLILGAAYYACVKKGILKSPKQLASAARTKNTAALPEKRTLTEEDFRAVGVSYYEANIRKLACRNPDWSKTAAQLLKAGKGGKRIFKDNYVNRPVKLVEEPDNPHDPNAVAVMVAGELVGYISREENARVRNILHSREIISLSGFIGGGEFKIIAEDGSIFKDKNGFNVNIRIKYI